MDLVKAINQNPKIKYIGIRRGEKIHEDLITPSDSINTYDIGKYFVIMPEESQFYKKFKKVKSGFNYNSGTNLDFLSVSDLKKRLQKID